jgi:hypothetical protein
VNVRRREILPALLALGLVATPSVLGADEVSVRAYIEPENRVTDARPMRLVIRVDGTQMPDVSVGKFPELANLRVVSGPDTARSTSFEFTGGSARSSATVTLSYTLLPLRSGPAEIPPITVRVGSTSYATAPIRFQVAHAATSPPPAAPREGPKSRADEEAAGGYDYFLRTELSATEIWVNQPVVLGVTLLSAAPVSSFGFTESPSLTSFWAEDLQVNPEAERYRTTVGGRAYAAYPVARKLLIPTAAGEITIGPYVAQLQVRRRARDLFSEFFSLGGVQTVLRRTDPVRVRVRALPETGRPDDFSGAVGAFRMRVVLDRTEAQLNDAVALRATVEGQGSLQGVPPPLFQAPPDMKTFEPKVTETRSTAGGKLSSTKTWEWVLVPLVPGDLRLSPLRFSFFDPAQESYREIQNEPLTLVVRRGEGAPEETVAQGEIRPQMRDIAFIKARRGPLAEGSARVQERPLFLALLALPFGVAPLLIFVGRRQARLHQDRGLARARRARSRARKQLKAAQRDLQQLDSGTFHEQVSRALVEFVADRFDRSPAGLTYDVTDELLASRHVDPALRQRVRTCLETCDFARFVPASEQAERKAQALKDATELVDALERAL